VPPKAAFSAWICALGPMMSVVPVSAIAYADELIIVDPTLTLFKLDHQYKKENLNALRDYLVI
jgi:hypothetical protein